MEKKRISLEKYNLSQKTAKLTDWFIDRIFKSKKNQDLSHYYLQHNWFEKLLKITISIKILIQYIN